jgi:hypothetical protein
VATVGREQEVLGVILPAGFPDREAFVLRVLEMVGESDSPGDALLGLLVNAAASGGVDLGDAMRLAYDLGGAVQMTGAGRAPAEHPATWAQVVVDVADEMWRWLR